MADTSGPAGDAAVEVLGLLNRLIVQACRSESRQALTFRVLNDTTALCPYDRALLWDLSGISPKLAGASGQAETNSSTQLADDGAAVVRSLPSPREAQVVRRDTVPDAADRFDTLANSVNGLSLLWLPLIADGELRAGVWLERWDGHDWSEDEVDLLRVLADGYGAALEKFSPRFSPKRLLPATRRGRMIVTGVLLALLYILFVHPFRMKVVAPCEVVAENPVVVAAPVEGVVRMVHVEPGDRVKAGDLLFEYDPEVPEQALAVALQQVAIVSRRLDRARSDAFESDDALSEAAVLALRYEQEQAKLRMAQWTVNHLRVTADAAGEIMIDRPHEWRGKPVRVGEKVMEIVKPNDTKLRIWLAEDDNVAFAENAGGYAFLNIRPGESVPVDLSYVAPKATLSPAHMPAFLAEADWNDPANAPRIGLKGTVVLYGPRVSLAYWLFRKPWSAFRRTVGF